MPASAHLNRPDYDDLCAAFGAALPARTALMRAALEREDLAAVQSAAHTLAGSAASFGFACVGKAAAGLEGTCRAADLAGSRAAFAALCAAARTAAAAFSKDRP